MTSSNIERESIQYALAKQVPDMERGCVIETNYGSLSLEPEDAQKVAALVGQLLREKLLNAIATPLPPISIPIIGVLNVDNPRDPRHKEWK